MKKTFAAITRAFGLALAVAMNGFSQPARAAALDLSGYLDEHGVISVQHRGTTSDPYFVLQALLLAQEHGLDTTAVAKTWAAWMIPKQKPDGTFDRFCRNGTAWAACKTADADDSLLALWLKFLESHPAELKRNPDWARSHQAARTSLKRLEDKGRGIYMVSPVYLHGLFMDNLEVWTYAPAHAGVQSDKFPDFGKAIHETFWDEGAKRYHVSTQLEQRTAAETAFYPDAIAQVFPILVRFPHVPGGPKAYYRQWMTKNRAEWLRQVKTDFAWGLIAVVALQQDDIASARCWLRESLPARHGPHWTVTDEVAAQILRQRGLSAARPQDDCR